MTGVVRTAFGLGIAILVVAAIGYSLSQGIANGHPAAVFLLAVGPLATGATLLVVGVLAKTWRSWIHLVQQFALVILIIAVLGSCALVWGGNLLYGWVTIDLVASAANVADDVSWFGAPLTLAEVQAGQPTWLPGWASVLIWPLQYRFVRDIGSLAVVFGFFNLVPAYVIWWERKVAGRIQSRLGPMRVGGWHGWAQSIADGIKLILKEDLVPAAADKPLYLAAPYFAIIPSLMAFVALPFGAAYVFRDLDVALIFILAMLGIEVVSVIMAGWASNNKWSVYGAMREACQMVSYEIPMSMALLVPIICVGSLSLTVIGEAQNGGWWSWLAFSNPFAFGAFVAYFIASLASCKRAPFDLPESESELVAGFLTEYSGFRWSLFFFAEYAAMFVVCGIATILFLGAWHSPLPASWGDALGDSLAARGLQGLLFSSGPIWFLLKCMFLLYVQLWLRWTLPRIRIDQVLYACIQVLLPLTMLLLFGTTLWIWADVSAGSTWASISAFTNWVLGAVGLVFILGFITIAGYGFYHRRSLVGNLAVDAKPWS